MQILRFEDKDGYDRNILLKTDREVKLVELLFEAVLEDFNDYAFDEVEELDDK